MKRSRRGSRACLAGALAAAAVVVVVSPGASQAALAASAGAVADAAAFAVAAPASGYLRAPGGPLLTDGFGRRVELHGVNLVAKCPADSKPSSATSTPCIPRALTDPLQPTNYFLSPTAVDPDQRFTDVDAAALAAMGFNVARVGIIWRGLEPGPSTVGVDDPTYCTAHLTGGFTAHPELYNQATVDAYLAHVDREVRLLAAHGIYSLIDMHQDSWNEHFNNPSSATPWEGEGAPLWATCTSPTALVPNTADTSSQDDHWNAGYTHNTAMAAAYDHFWNNDVSGNLQGEYLKTWQAVATHFAANQWVAGYDPYNEPYDSFSTLAADNFDRKLQCFYAGPANTSCSLAVPPPQNVGGFIPTVRAVDSQHLVFFEAPIVTDFSFPETIGAAGTGGLPFGGLVLNFHNYGVSGGLINNGDCTQPDCQVSETATQSQFDLARQKTQTNQAGGPAWFLSEFGAEDDPGDIARVTGLADSSPQSGAPVSWTYWSALQSHDPTGSTAERLFDSARNLVQPKGCVLTRAYPRAIAGVPTAQAFDVATGQFTLTYLPDPAIASGRHPTEIELPAPRFGRGYTVAVSGATVTSAAGAQLLKLRNAGTAPVVLTVAPLHPDCAVILPVPGGGGGTPSPSPGPGVTGSHSPDTAATPPWRLLALPLLLSAALLLAASCRPRPRSRRRG